MRIPKFINRIARKPAIQHGLAVLADQSLMSLATFIIGVLVARSATPAEYGIYVLTWTLVFIVIGIHRAIVLIPYTVYVPRFDEDERNRYSASCLIHTAAISAAALGATATWAAFAYHGDTPHHAGDTVTIYLLAMATSIPYLIREYLRGMLLARLRFYSSLMANGMVSIIALLLIYFAYREGALGVEYAYIIIGCTAAVASAYMLLLHRGYFAFRAAPVWRHFRHNLGIGKWILINVAGFTVASQIFPWLLLWIQDADSVAAYGAAVAVSGVLTPFLRGANAYILPRMTHGFQGSDQARLLHLLRMSILALSIPFGIWLLVTSIFGEQIMNLVYAEKYQGYGLAMAILTARTAIEGISTPLTSALQTLERPQAAAVALLFGAASSILAGVYLVKIWSVNGAAIAAALSSLVIALWKYVQIRKLATDSQLNSTG